MHRCHANSQIFEREGYSLSSLFAFNTPDRSCDLKRHGEDRNVVAESINELKTSLLSLLVRCSKSTMRQFGNCNHGKPKLGLSPGCLDLL